MVLKEPSRHFQQLLRPLYEAGWLDIVPMQQVASSDSPENLQQIALRRSCMVLGVQHELNSTSGEQLTFVPVAAYLDQPDDGIGFFDAVTEARHVVAASHRLQPFHAEAVAASLGLLDPTRFTLSDGSPDDHVDLLMRLYGRYVGRVASMWRGGHTVRALDADDPFSRRMKTVMWMSSDVIPDPVPMAAAIGITLDCWRHTELETAHAASKTLTDVVMAKMSIGTTRAVRAYVTVDGIDWQAVGGVLLDPERQLSHGRSVASLIGDKDWRAVQESIAAKLDSWTQIEAIAGPEATLRLASVMGSSDYTARWWGNGWWEEFSGPVLRHVQETHPDLLQLGAKEFASRRLIDELFHAPDMVPDSVLKGLIDPPNGRGLRRSDLPKVPTRLLDIRTVLRPQPGQKAA